MKRRDFVTAIKETLKQAERISTEARVAARVNDLRRSCGVDPHPLPPWPWDVVTGKKEEVQHDL